jgi:cobalt-zinc-cadmium efflux system membrane fusion protein
MKYSAIVLSLVCICSCSPVETTTQPDTTEVAHEEEVILTPAQLAALNIQFGKIETRALSNMVRVTGVLDVPPQNMVTISAPLGGFVKQTSLLQGMRVQKGDVIVTLEHPDYIQLQQDYLETKNQLEFLELEYNRQQELAAENINAAKTLQQAKSNFLSAKAKLEGLQSRLKLINLSPQGIESGEIKSTISLVSPINGYVSQVNVNLGMYVNPTDVMFKIVDTAHLHAEAQVFEKDLMKLKAGQRVWVTLAYENSPRQATVYLIGKEISTDRSVRVHCHLTKEDPSLIPGMFFSGVIEVGDEKVMALPSGAIASFEGKSYIFLKKEDTAFQWVEVITGHSDAGYTEVTLPEGFDLNSDIVISGTYALISKLKNTEEEE